MISSMKKTRALNVHGASLYYFAAARRGEGSLVIEKKNSSLKAGASCLSDEAHKAGKSVGLDDLI